LYSLFAFYGFVRSGARCELRRLGRTSRIDILTQGDEDRMIDLPVTLYFIQTKTAVLQNILLALPHVFFLFLQKFAI
ncbi:MAG: hypothetical protein PUP90_19325, partial [Nostoc sp. S4]|nr:hypothetical protein [Nostoc sp. S4]